MPYFLLSNASLEKLIKDAPIREEQKEKLLEKLPYLEKEDRIRLVKTLVSIILLEEEKEKEIKDLKESQFEEIV